MPVLIVMNKEFSTIPILHETTLATAGLAQGGVIRVLYRFAEFTLNDALQQMVNLSKRLPEPPLSPSTQSTAPVAALAGSAAVASQTTPPSGKNVGVNQPNVTTASATESLPAPSASEAPKGNETSVAMEEDENAIAPPAEETGPFERNIVLFEPPAANEGGTSSGFKDFRHWGVNSYLLVAGRFS